MRKCFIILMILINILGKSNSDYILPFDTCNIGINKTLLKEDFYLTYCQGIFALILL